MPGKFEELMASHDGEKLSRDAEEAVSRLTEDPESRKLLEKLEQADRAYSDAADELLELPVPPELVEAICKPKAATQSTETTVIPFPRRRGVIGLAVAAGLAAVVATNTMLFESPSESTDATGLFASLLQETLESVPSGDIADSEDGSIRITPVLTFRTASAGYCREFTAIQNGMETSGVACRDQLGQWNVASQRQTPVKTGSDDYLAAQGQETEPDLPADVVKTEELSYSVEQQVIRSNWSESRP